MGYSTGPMEIVPAELEHLQNVVLNCEDLSREEAARRCSSALHKLLYTRTGSATTKLFDLTHPVWEGGCCYSAEAHFESIVREAIRRLPAGTMHQETAKSVILHYAALQERNLIYSGGEPEAFLLGQHPPTRVPTWWKSGPIRQ